MLDAIAPSPRMKIFSIYKPHLQFCLFDPVGSYIWLPNFQEVTVTLASPTISRDLIHRRCGHLHEAGLEKLDALGIDGIRGYSSLPPFSFCTHCAIAKSKVAKVNKESTRDRDPPAPFHTFALDIWGPTSTEDIGGNIWFLGDVFFKTSTVIGNVMKYKSDAPYTWKTMIASVKSLGYSMLRTYESYLYSSFPTHRTFTLLK